MPSAAIRFRSNQRTRAERALCRGGGRGRRLRVRRHGAGRPPEALAVRSVGALIEHVGLGVGDVARLDNLFGQLAQALADAAARRAAARLRALRLVRRAARPRALERILQAADRDRRLGLFWWRQCRGRPCVPRDRLVRCRARRVEGRRSVDAVPLRLLLFTLADAAQPPLCLCRVRRRHCVLDLRL
jgi:hypothetical protein